MTKEEKINYWIKASDIDLRAMNNLYKSSDFVWALFTGHLVIEKLLKALYVQNISDVPPPSHNLLRLAELSNIQLDETQKYILAKINTFNIKARYPDQKFEFHKQCTQEFTKKSIQSINEIKEWLLQMLKPH